MNPYFNPQTLPTYDQLKEYNRQGRAYNRKQWFNKNADGIADGVASGLAAGAAHSQPAADFTIDPYSGFKGSFQGLAGGSKSGPVGAVVGAITGGITAQVGQFKKINENLRNLDTSVNAVTYDAYGRPMYAGGNINTAQANLGELDKGINKLNQTHIDPFNNIYSSITGTRRRMKRKRGQLQQGIQQAQQGFNTADVNFRNQQAQMADYYSRMNSNNRMYNVFRSQYGQR